MIILDFLPIGPSNLLSIAAPKLAVLHGPK